MSITLKVLIQQFFFAPVFNTYFFGMQAILSGAAPAAEIEGCCARECHQQCEILAGGDGVELYADTGAPEVCVQCGVCGGVANIFELLESEGGEAEADGDVGGGGDGEG